MKKTEQRTNCKECCRTITIHTEHEKTASFRARITASNIIKTAISNGRRVRSGGARWKIAIAITPVAASSAAHQAAVTIKRTSI